MSRFPPITNATLTRVRTGGGAEDYDESATTGADKWAGATGAFVSDEAVGVEGAGDTSVVVQRSVVVDDALPVVWARGDALTYTFRGATLTGTVRDVKTTTAPGLLGVVRLVLRDA